jgi:hypothetical protein
MIIGLRAGRTFGELSRAAALLSLGAPFWFNALKTLSNLRPVLANREQKEREASEKR